MQRSLSSCARARQNARLGIVFTGALGSHGEAFTYAAPPNSTAAALLQAFAAGWFAVPKAPAGSSQSLFSAVPAVTVAHVLHPGHAVA